MTQLSGTNDVVALASGWSRVGAYAQLSKARLSALVVLTAAAAFVVATPPGTAMSWAAFLWTITGTALAAAAANAFNELIEMHRDALMTRTQGRPLVAATLTPAQALRFGLLAGALGVGTLAVMVNPGAALLALATILIYVGVYTPLKPRTTLNTLVGAVVGALPPLIGWVAAAGRLEPAAWVLSALLFLWQIPHFLSLAWLYRDDYARGGFAMLPVFDRDGALTGRVVLLTCLALVPLSLAATAWGLAGRTYAAGAIVLGAVLVVLGAAFLRRRTTATARRVFLASILYLPILLCLMVLDR
jgi:protoheme IX farnesyltransferase